MHPAPSIVLFTTASGAGYGLLALLGALAAAGGLTPGGAGLAALLLGLALVVTGLSASTFHLKHPERAWRALTQWRSSWLSREGVVSVLAFGPILAFAAGWLADPGAWWRIAGGATAAASVLVVVCTGMIYASLKPIAAWRTPWTVPVFLGFAAMTGTLLLAAVLASLGSATADLPAVGAALVVLAWALQAGYRRHVARHPHPATRESATGLGALGRVRPLDPPHTETNYLLKEFGFRLARKHADKLRRIAVAAGGILPFALAAAAALGSPGTPALLWAAALSALLGVAVVRWLFFAEATHTAMLYY